MFFLQFNEVLSTNTKEKNSLNFEIVIIIFTVYETENN